MQAMRDLVTFGLTEGQKDAESLGYIPLPPAVVTKATDAIQHLGTK
jgi:phosphate transport system substrate-binding protein